VSLAVNERELDFQNRVKRRLEREGWEVRSNVRIRTAQGGSLYIDLVAVKPRRELVIEVKPNWPPYSALGQLLYYRSAVYLEKEYRVPRDLAIATWRSTPDFDTPLWMACWATKVRLILFDSSFRAFTVKHVGSSWRYVRLTELAAPKP
jgi:hypothetical protein